MEGGTEGRRDRRTTLTIWRKVKRIENKERKEEKKKKSPENSWDGETDRDTCVPKGWEDLAGSFLAGQLGCRRRWECYGWTGGAGEPETPVNVTL